MKFSHRMTGYDEMRKRLAELPAAVQREVSLAALKDAAEPMRAEAAALAPRSRGAGQHMADHIVVADTRFGGDNSPDVSTVAIGPEKKFFYAEFVEFGTAHTHAQPFMRPAFDATKGEVKRRIAAAFQRAMAAVFKGTR